MGRGRGGRNQNQQFGPWCHDQHWNQHCNGNKYHRYRKRKPNQDNLTECSTERNSANEYINRTSEGKYGDPQQPHGNTAHNTSDGMNNTGASTGARSKERMNLDDKHSTSNRRCENSAVPMQQGAPPLYSKDHEPQLQRGVYDGSPKSEKDTMSVVTVNGDKNWKSEKTHGSSSTSQRKSPAMPHNNKCLELGIRCTKYCIGCTLWLCDECAAFGHNKRHCALVSHTNALSDKKQEYENTVKATADSIKLSVQELESYNSQLEAALMLMRAAFENMEKKHELVKAYIKDGTQRLEKIEAERANFPDAKNLPEALAIFNNIERDSNEAHSWLSKKAQCTGNTSKMERVLKDMLYMTFECLQSLKKESEMQQSQIYVCRELPNGKILSELKAEGSRIYIQSLTPRQSVIEGARVLPLEYIMSCIECDSRLAFFDLSWGGCPQGRVFVRLTGDTQRGRQFVKLCTGETGPCFRGSRFHRVWWKGQQGEHIWGGDYERGDGSGGQSLKEDNREAPVQHRKAPVTAGLVAGRYEKDNVSSIFRIFTKGIEGMMEETAFGQVEFGLNIIEKATKLSNITDVTINECGIVLEV